MGLLCDYFLAGSDEAAAGTIGWIGGPGAASPPDQAFEVVDGSGIEPVVQMGTLESILTGRSQKDVPLSCVDRSPSPAEFAAREFLIAGGQHVDEPAVSGAWTRTVTPPQHSTLKPPR